MIPKKNSVRTLVMARPKKESEIKKLLPPNKSMKATGYSPSPFARAIAPAPYFCRSVDINE
jgi:hypothetical protein